MEEGVRAQHSLHVGSMTAATKTEFGRQVQSRDGGYVSSYSSLGHAVLRPGRRIGWLGCRSVTALVQPHSLCITLRALVGEAVSTPDTNEQSRQLVI